MENVFRLILANPRISSKLTNILTYFSILLFIGLVFFVSSSVNKYVNDTLSISVIEPESSGFQEEVPEEFSQIVTIKKGHTLNTILMEQKLPKNDVMQITKLVKAENMESSLKIGQKIIFDYEIKILENDNEDLASETRVLNKVTIVIDKLKSLEIIERHNKRHKTWE